MKTGGPSGTPGKFVNRVPSIISQVRSPVSSSFPPQAPPGRECRLAVSGIGLGGASFCRMQMHLTVILAVALLASSPEVLILRSGEAVPIRRVVSLSETRIVFESPTGVLFSLPLSELDVEKTADGESAENVGVSAGTARSNDKLRLAVADEEKERLLRTLEKTARRGMPPPQFEKPPVAGDPHDSAETSGARSLAEGQWRERGRAARERIAEAEFLLREAERYERELNAFLLAMASPYGIPEVYSAYMRDLADTRSRIPMLREEVSRAREAFETLKTEANRAGALPGWLH
jgi:hypothetical protein